MIPPGGRLRIGTMPLPYSGSQSACAVLSLPGRSDVTKDYGRAPHLGVPRETTRHGDNLIIVKEWVLNPLNEYFALHDGWHTPDDPKRHKRPIHADHPCYIGPEDLDTIGRLRRPSHEAWLSADRSLGHPTADAALFGESELTHDERRRDWPVRTNHPPFPSPFGRHDCA